MYSGKLKRNFLIKIILFIFSLVSLSVILYLIILLQKLAFFDPEIIALRAFLIILLVPTIIFVITLTALTVKEYQN